MSRRLWLGTAAMAAMLVAAAPVAGQSNPPPVSVGGGTVMVGQQGSAADLALTDAEKAAASAAAAGKLVGIVAATMATEYHANLNNTAKAALEALGFTVQICDTETGDAAKAVTCFEQFIQQGAAAIITASSTSTVGQQATDAIAAGTIVVQVTGLDLGAVGAVSISVDNLTIGSAEGQGAGEYAAATWPDADVQTIILDYPDIADLVARADAIESAMIAADPRITVVARLLGGLPANGTTSMEQALQQYPDLHLVTGINDGGNLGAYAAAQTAVESGALAADQLAIFGIDCDPAAVEAIDEGGMYKGCVDTNPKGTGELAANAIGKLIAGGSVPGTVEVPVSVYTGK